MLEFMHLYMFLINKCQKNVFRRGLVIDQLIDLINNDFLKHKQANINVKIRRFGVIVTPFSRQSE